MVHSDALHCPHAANCGGCAFIGLPYSEQLERKQELIRRAFARYPELSGIRSAKVSGAHPTLSYRARAKLVFGPDGALGLYERDSHRVVDIPECRVLAPALSRVAAAARRVHSLAPAPLDGLDLRLIDRGVLATLIAPRGTPLEGLRGFAQRLCSEAAELCSVAASFRDPGTATVLGTGHVLLSGAEVERHHLLATGPYHLAAHGAFTQAHLGQANAAHDAIERALHGVSAKRVLELYAGSGALSLRLASAGFELLAVEAFGPALEHAERAAREQHLTLKAVSGQAESVLAELCARETNFDALIVNPPRRGLSPEVRRHAALLEPNAIVYMSCEPLTLARDMAHLSRLGYSARELSPFDMIPHSAAVECLVTLKRAELPHPLVLRETEQLIAVLKSGHEPVFAEPGAPSLLERVRRLPGASTAQPLANQALDEDCSGVCVFARSLAALPLLEQAFGQGTQSFVGLARGVTHKRGRIRRPVREGRRPGPASTRYVRDAVRLGHSLLTIWPEDAGPTQLRQLFAAIGHPLLGDVRFGDAASNQFFEHRHGLERSFLHCSSVTLNLGSGPVTIEAPLPGELSALLAGLSEPATAPS